MRVIRLFPCPTGYTDGGSLPTAEQVPHKRLLLL